MNTKWVARFGNAILVTPVDMYVKTFQICAMRTGYCSRIEKHDKSLFVTSSV